MVDRKPGACSKKTAPFLFPPVKFGRLRRRRFHVSLFLESPHPLATMLSHSRSNTPETSSFDFLKASPFAHPHRLPQKFPSLLSPPLLYLCLNTLRWKFTHKSLHSQLTHPPPTHPISPIYHRPTTIPLQTPLRHHRFVSSEKQQFFD